MGDLGQESFWLGGLNVSRRNHRYRTVTRVCVSQPWDALNVQTRKDNIIQIYKYIMQTLSLRVDESLKGLQRIAHVNYRDLVQVNTAAYDRVWKIVDEWHGLSVWNRLGSETSVIATRSPFAIGFRDYVKWRKSTAAWRSANNLLKKSFELLRCNCELLWC